jgi:EpsI family protein
MLNTPTRLLIRLLVVAILVGLLAASTHVVPEKLKPKSVQLPDWDLADMPLELGQWQGVEGDLDPEVTRALDAEAWVDREYRDEEDHAVSVHVALFTSLDDGVRHNPSNCYRGNGWRETERERLMLHFPDHPSIPVSLGTWTREGEQVLVMYWFQLSTHVIFDRWDLWLARLDLLDQDVWPAMVKVLLQADATEGRAARERIEAVARGVYEWINQQDHQTGSRSPIDATSTGEVDGDEPAA